MSTIEKVAALFVILAAGYWFFYPDSNVEPLIVLIMSVAALATSLFSRFSKSNKTPSYSGDFDESFAEFVHENQDKVFALELFLDEDYSRIVCAQNQGRTNEKMFWLNVTHGDVGTEFGFDRNDPEIHWNSRFGDSVYTKGFFKVHSIQGPYQGWMSVVLKGVGKEHIKA